MAAPPSAGTSLPSISGQSVNASPRSTARTYVPTSSSANVAPVVNSVSCANAPSPPAVGPFRGSSRAERSHGDEDDVGDERERRRRSGP